MATPGELLATKVKAHSLQEAQELLPSFPFSGIFIPKMKSELTNSIFANRSKADIINEDEFKKMLGNNFINVLSDEQAEGYSHGFITEDFLKQSGIDLKKHVYVCGPPPMMDAVEQQLLNLNIDKQLIVKEEF